MLRTTFFTLVLTVLAACGSSTNPYAPAPQSKVIDGVPTVALRQGGGYTYSALIDGSGSAQTEADLIAGLNVRPTPVAGNATFTGRFDMDIVTDISGQTGTATSLSGPLTLDVDFQNRTVASRGSDLLVDGTYTDHDLTGTVSYDGLEGQLTGGIGSRQAIGIFTREAADSIYAGGFYTNDAN